MSIDENIFGSTRTEDTEWWKSQGTEYINTLQTENTSLKNTIKELIQGIEQTKTFLSKQEPAHLFVDEFCRLQAVLTQANNVIEHDPDINVCPECGGEADNGFDRCLPPSPYVCTKCQDKQATNKEGGKDE